MRRFTLSALAIACAAPLTLTAQDRLSKVDPQVLLSIIVPEPDGATKPAKPTKEAREAEAFRRLRVDKRTVRKCIAKINKGLKWHKKLARAAAAAQKENKPIVWIQALGDVRGYT